MKSRLSVSIIILLSIVIPVGIIVQFFSGEIQLSEYATRNPDEKGILAVLMQYQNAKNRFDLDRLLACLHEKGHYSFKGVAMVSKATLKDRLPGFWTALRSPDRIVLYPLSHEFVTGDYYVSGRFINPHLLVSGDAATVMVTFASGWWRQKLYVSMLRVDHGWLINRLEWQEA